ncbi:Hypothetical protein PHPALM_6168 [Phytophthora palmivora]|uniref:Uncharacterized protein n=1 Tax=Phytophthora palmivora TaxID=4796 RepID=A0A2P4YFI9_9STRA|nr:Hypothetical protein PHPALM_6168 [Phytophthora palmivora]
MFYENPIFLIGVPAFNTIRCCGLPKKFREITGSTISLHKYFQSCPVLGTLFPGSKPNFDLVNHSVLLWKMIEFKNLSMHSVRKGVVTFACGGSTGGPSIVSVWTIYRRNRKGLMLLWEFRGCVRLTGAPCYNFAGPITYQPSAFVIILFTNRNIVQD